MIKFVNISMYHHKKRDTPPGTLVAGGALAAPPQGAPGPGCLSPAEAAPGSSAPRPALVWAVGPGPCFAPVLGPALAVLHTLKMARGRSTSQRHWYRTPGGARRVQRSRCCQAQRGSTSAVDRKHGRRLPLQVDLERSRWQLWLQGRSMGGQSKQNDPRRGLDSFSPANDRFITRCAQKRLVYGH